MSRRNTRTLTKIPSCRTSEIRTRTLWLPMALGRPTGAPISIQAQTARACVCARARLQAPLDPHWLRLWGGGGAGMHWKGGGGTPCVTFRLVVTPSPPPGRPAYAQPQSP